MNIDKLKQVIQEANPSILELKFGCRVRDTLNKPYTKIYIVLKESNVKTIWNTDAGAVHIDDIEILGRQITLSDVLMTLSDKYTTIEKGIFIDAMGRFWDIKHTKNHNNEMTIITHWDLKKTLENQSDPTKQFLIDLLVKAT